MSEQTFHLTKEDLRKPESRTAQLHNGETPKNSNVSALKVSLTSAEEVISRFLSPDIFRQSHIDQNVDKSKIIEERKANLPLPDQPPTASDWTTADQRTVNVGSGGVEAPVSGEGNSALREPATAGSSARESGEVLHKPTEPGKDVGRQGKENLDQLPKDARAH